jgi:prolipoprotein diacylglyceryl transferase
MLDYIHWNPREVIFETEFITLRWYSVCFALAFFLGFKITQKIFRKEGINDEKTDKILIYVVIATILGARLGHVIFYEGWDFIKANPVETFFPFSFKGGFHFTGFQGLASHGGSLAVIIALFMYAKNVLKKPASWVFDRLTPSIALASFFIRMGNLMNSEIIGNKTNVPFAFIFEKRDEFPRHPSQLYEALAYLLIFFIMKRMLKDGMTAIPWKMFGWMITLIFSARFVIEFTKISQGGDIENILGLFSTGQWLSIPFVVAGIVLIYRKKN